MNKTENLSPDQRFIQLNKKSVTEIIWKCAHRHLWNKFPFSEKEINRAKELIAEYFDEVLPEVYLLNSQDKIVEYATRILLAADYIKSKPDRYITHPIIWFNPSNPFGFQGTKAWYDRYIEKEQYGKFRFFHKEGKIIVEIKEINN